MPPDTDLATRSAAPRDADAIARLLGELGYPTAPEQVPARLERLSSDARAVVIVAEESGRVIGLATAHTHSSIHVDGEVAWITSLVVGSARRKHGVGRRLVAALEAWARSRGCVRLSVTTALHRHEAHAFYERLGFEFTGRRYTRPLSGHSA